MKTKKGFTLVELLAVIAILAILVIIALPNVINLYTKAQKETFLTETKKIYTESEKKFISNSINNKKTRLINSENNTKLDMTGEKLQYCVILGSNGKVTSMKVSNGKWVASLEEGKTVDDLTIDDLEEGNLDDNVCSLNPPKVPKATNCTFDGKLKQGAEYINGQYTYRYKQERNSSTWKNIDYDGWGVVLTDKKSTDAVTSKVCTYINNKPVVSMSEMFYYSDTPEIDLSSFNTSKVINMSDMFSNSKAVTLDVSNFNTSKVVDMSGMFSSTIANNIDVSKFDTGSTTNMSSMFLNIKVKALDLSSFDTSNVTDMSYMFACNSSIENIDLSSFDTSKVTNMSRMFGGKNILGCENISFKKINIDSFNTSKVTDMSGMFSYTKNLNVLNLSGFDTSSVTDMSSMFYDSRIEKIDVSNFNTSNVTDMGRMFSFTEATILGLHNFDTSKVINMNEMFRGTNAKELNLSSFDTSNVTDMGGMFDMCSKLKTIYASDKFVTNKVTNHRMFFYCDSLVGGAGTKYNSTKTDKTYARIDGGTSSPGYFTLKN